MSFNCGSVTFILRTSNVYMLLEDCVIAALWTMGPNRNIISFALWAQGSRRSRLKTLSHLTQSLLVFFKGQCYSGTFPCRFLTDDLVPSWVPPSRDLFLMCLFAACVVLVSRLFLSLVSSSSAGGPVRGRSSCADLSVLTVPL